MSIFTVQSIAGGFLDEDLDSFNKVFDDWCVQFNNYEEAMKLVHKLGKQDSLSVVEITPLSYPKYFFSGLKGTVYLTRELENKIICAIEPYVGSSFKIAICDLKTKQVKMTKTNYKTMLSVEVAFTNFGIK